MLVQYRQVVHFFFLHDMDCLGGQRIGRDSDRVASHDLGHRLVHHLIAVGRGLHQPPQVAIGEDAHKPTVMVYYAHYAPDIGGSHHKQAL